MEFVSGQEVTRERRPRPRYLDLHIDPGLRSREESYVRSVVAIASVAGSWCPSLSPSGDRVAYITDRDGTPRVEVGPTGIALHSTVFDVATAGDAAAAGTLVVSGPDQEAISVSWSPDGRWLTYLVSPGGSIRAELHAVRPDGTDRHLLAGGGEFETVFAGLWTHTPGQYAFSMAEGTGPDVAVWLVDVETSRAEVVQASVGIGFCTVTSVSADGSRAVVRCGPRGRRRLLLLDTVGGRAPIPLLQNSFPDEKDPGEDGRFAPDHRSVYLRTTAGRERAALCNVPLHDDGQPGVMTVVAERDGADLEFYALRSDGRTAVLVWNVDGESIACVKDLVSGTELPIPLDQPVMPGWALARDGLSMIAELTGPTSPRCLVHLVLPTLSGGRAVTRRLACVPVSDLPEVVVRPTLHRYASADGLELHGLLFRPRTAHGPGPTVVSFHGGPESQERPAFSLLTQSLVAAGITVFAPNVRGSSGYGTSFMAADDGPARPDSFQDVPATVDFLVDSGLARAGSIGVQGWSYGGYLALTALTRWPEMFAAGTTHAGMSDLLSFFAETEPWMAAASVTEYGDPVLSADLLRALSPLTHLSRVVTPTLLVHGAKDTNVPVGESIRAHVALKSAGVPTELILLEGEGHTIVGAAHRAELALAVCGWFVRWLVQA